MIRMIGTVILLIGLAVTAYGAVAFFLVQSLPPNGGPNGRLPSVYILFGGMAGMFLGMVVRGLGLGVTKK